MHAGSADKQSELVLKGQLGTWWIMSALEMANEDVLAQILQIYIFISMCPFRVCRSVCRLLCLSVVMSVCLLSPPAPPPPHQHPSPTSSSQFHPPFPISEKFPWFTARFFVLASGLRKHLLLADHLFIVISPRHT